MYCAGHAERLTTYQVLIHDPCVPSIYVRSIVHLSYQASFTSSVALAGLPYEPPTTTLIPTLQPTARDRDIRTYFTSPRDPVGGTCSSSMASPPLPIPASGRRDI